MRNDNIRVSFPLISVRKFETILFKKAVLSVFEPMKRGSLKLVLPDGTKLIFGNEPEGLNASIRIKDENFFRRCVLYSDVGFGESFVAGEWETDDVTAVISWMLLNIDSNPAVSGTSARTWIVGLFRLANRVSHALRDNTRLGSKKNIREHYDLGNDFFRLFLDETMTYSSADFSDGIVDLTRAQIKKYARLCHSLQVKSSDHVLEIGSGWGGFALYVARNYGCKVTTVTISQEQYNWTRERVRQEGLSNLVTVKLCDYRDIDGSYDKIASIEMLEAVGARHLKTYFKICNRLLKSNGLLGLQVITCPDSRFESLKNGVDWTQKHIFPGSLLPSLAAIQNAVNKSGDLNLYGLHDMGQSYARTLKEWRERFNANVQVLRMKGTSEDFIRKWNYYFSYCEAAFKMKNITVLQLLYSRPNNQEL